MKEVVILGAGYAGLRALKELQRHRTDCHVTLIDKHDYHYEATDLHEVATGMQHRSRISYDINDVVDRERTTFVQETVDKVDCENQKVICTNGKEVTYDYLIVALGFESETFGTPGVDEYALSMTNVDDAEKIYHHICEQMQLYKQTQDEDFLKIVVCGAGFTGVELMGALVEAKPEYAKIADVNPAQIEIYCVEASTRLLPMFNEKLASYGIDHLKEWGVKLYTGMRVKEIKPNLVMYRAGDDDPMKEISARTIIWTTGVRGSKVIAASGFSEKRGRVMVNDDLSAPDHDNVYIVGDVAAVMDTSTQRPYPTTAQISLKMGHHAAKNIIRQIAGQSTEPFSFKSLGSVASIGNTHAFGLVGTTPIKGYPASFVKKAIMDKSLLETGGVKETMSKGRFDFYH